MRQREAKVLEHNRELQHTILDLETKLEEVQDRSQTAFEMVRSLCTHCMPIAFNWVGALLYFAFRLSDAMFYLITLLAHNVLWFDVFHLGI